MTVVFPVEFSVPVLIIKTVMYACDLLAISIRLVSGLCFEMVNVCTIQNFEIKFRKYQTLHWKTESFEPCLYFAEIKLLQN